VCVESERVCESVSIKAFTKNFSSTRNYFTFFFFIFALKEVFEILQRKTKFIKNVNRKVRNFFHLKFRRPYFEFLLFLFCLLS